VTVLVAATVGVALVSEAMVGAIEEAREAFGWTELFVGVVVIAIVGNAAEHSTAILVAWKNQMDLSFQIAVGSAIQIALFVAPVLVFVSYLPGFPTRLDLIFDPMEVAAVMMSVLVVGLVAYDGESNWFEGLLLLAVYGILGIAFFNLPEQHPAEPPEEHSRQESVGGRRPLGVQAANRGVLVRQFPQADRDDARPRAGQERRAGAVPGLDGAVVVARTVASQPTRVDGPHNDQQRSRPQERFRHGPSLLVT
jgi:Ca2+/Na+ antiporter